MANVGKYTIHGSYGMGLILGRSCKTTFLLKKDNFIFNFHFLKLRKTKLPSKQKVGLGMIPIAFQALGEEVLGPQIIPKTPFVRRYLEDYDAPSQLGEDQL